VDIAETTHISLCTGYGGIDLGLDRAIRGLRTVAYVEIEAFACANLVAKMEEKLLDVAPIWTNLKTFDFGAFQDRVDILSGGYPCQPFSTAGKGLGKADPRHLWPWIADGIRAMRPRICFFENVDGHINKGLYDVLSELEGIGYDTTWGVFSASEVGAPHQRKRVFIMAIRKDFRCSGWTHQDGNDEKRVPECESEVKSMVRGKAQGCSGEPRKGDKLEKPLRLGSGSEGRNTLHEGRRASKTGSEGIQETAASPSGICRTAYPARPGQEQYDWEPPRVVGNSKVLRREEPGRSSEPSSGGEAKPALGRNSDGNSDRLDDAELYTSCDNRTDELRMIGNGVMPDVAFTAYVTLDKKLNHDC